MALLALFPISVLGFGVVHPWVRLGFAVVVVAVATPLAAAPGRYARPTAALTAGALLAWTLAALALLPVGAGGRALLQPDLAPVLDQALGLANAPLHPLAVDPPAALAALALGAAWLVTAVAAARAARARAGDVARLAVVTGVALVLLAWAQWATGATRILWLTDVGRPELQPFFGTFVNTNHGGAVAAALVPLAAVLAWAAGREQRIVWALAALVLTAGAWTSGSRGAVGILGVGLAVTLFLAVDRRVRVGLAAAGAAGALGLVVWGPTRALGALTQAVDPGHGADLYTRRPAMWADAAGLVGDAPLTGVGPGGFADAFPYAKTGADFVTAMHAHQEPLQVAVEHGLPVALLLGALIVALGGQVVRRVTELPVGRRRTWLAGFAGSAAALLALGLFDFPFRLGALAFLGALSVGTLLGLAAPAGRDDTGGPIRMPLRALAVAAVLFAAVAARQPDHTALALAAERSGDLDAAEASWRAAIAVRPLDAGAVRGLARVHHARGEADEAVDALLLATRLQPALPHAWVDLARVHRARRDAAASRAAWQRVLALDAPNDDDAEPWLREALTSGRDPLVVARAVLPERTDRRCAMASLLATLGRPGAREASEALFVELADEGHCRVEFATRLANWGRPAEALAQLEDATDGCDALRTRASALVALKRHEEALPALDAAMRACGSSDPVLRLGVARARLGSGDASGVGILERLVHEDPALHPARRLLWRELADRRRHAEAAAHLEWLVEASVATTEEQLALERERLLQSLELPLLAAPAGSR